MVMVIPIPIFLLLLYVLWRVVDRQENAAPPTTDEDFEDVEDPTR